MILKPGLYFINIYIALLTVFLVVICDKVVAQNKAISFNGSDDYLTFGNDSALYLDAYTVECWFMRTGAGIATNTGTGGLVAFPLVTRGIAQSDGNNRDLNYFMGIDSASNVLASDIEEGDLQYIPGLNHPVLGVTQILWNVWYHAAITFDANQVSVYLNGQLEMTVGLGVKTQSLSKQHAGVATGLNSYGVAKGFFCGVVDEVRVWNYLRTIEQIQNNINNSISSPMPGLVGAWGFNEISGDSVYDASGNSITGTLYGSGYNRVSGAPMNMSVNYVPDFPATISPLNNDTCVAVNNAELKVRAIDDGGDTLVVKYYGRPAHNSPPPFTIVPVPDTQHYVSGLLNGTTEGLKAQTNWIVANRANKNIVYVSQLGDCVQNGQNGGNDIEWRRADTAFTILENPVTTGLVDGIPYSICVGNHDQSGMGNPNGNTNFYNQFFGVSRFGTRSYYGGYYGNNYDNHYTFFTASGMEFIDVSLEFDSVVNPLVVQWADSIIQAYPNKRAIVSSHYLLKLDMNFSDQGQALYDQLKDNPNFFLMLCGHKHDEGRRTDVFNGNTVQTILSDYQSRPSGGNGWIKVMDFKPSMNKVFVKTYSPYLDLYESDWNSEYTFDYNMTPAYQLLGIDTVTSGNESSLVWTGLQMNSSYEWYAEISDGIYEKTSYLNRFRTNNNEQISLGNDIAQCEGQVTIGSADTNYTYSWPNGNTNPFVTVNQTGNYVLTATSIAGNCSVKDSILVTINPNPQSYLGADTVACGQLILGAEVQTSFIYTWQNGSSDSIFTALTSDIYSLYIQDSVTGCFSSDTIDVVIYPFPVINLGSDTSQCEGSVPIGVNITGSTYLWSNGSTNDSIVVNQTGNYFLTATSIAGNCAANDSILVTINPIPQSYLGIDTAACGQLLLGASIETNFIYTWQDGNTDSVFTALNTDVYSLYMQDTITGCFSSDTVNVVIHPFPVVNLGSDTTLCGGSVQLGINASGNTYLWSTGSTNNFIVVNQTGNYSLTASSNPGGCLSSDSITVVINAIPEINMASDTSGCEQVILDANIGSGYFYSWQNGNIQPSIVTDQSGEYIISVEDILTGCLNSDTTAVEIFQLPVFSLGEDITCNICNHTISAPAEYQTYLWNTGETGNEIHISVPGVYAVSITDNNGCVARDSIRIFTSGVIYPNPVTDYLVVNLSNFQNDPTIQIIDELGQLMTSIIIKNEMEHKIDCRHLAKGTYFLIISGGDEKKQYKFVKL